MRHATASYQLFIFSAQRRESTNTSPLQRDSVLMTLPCCLCEVSISFVYDFSGGSLVYLVESQLWSETGRLSLFLSMCSTLEDNIYFDQRPKFIYHVVVVRRIVGIDIGLHCGLFPFAQEGILVSDSFLHRPGRHPDAARRCNWPVW